MSVYASCPLQPCLLQKEDQGPQKQQSRLDQAMTMVA